jgi:hypothetical protein
LEKFELFADTPDALAKRAGSVGAREDWRPV